LGLNDQLLNQTLHTINDNFESWMVLINKSFLSKEMKEKYITLLDERRKVIW
jgi:hypothetical protein